MDSQGIENQNAEVWQINADGQIYETNFEELTQWITEGSLLPQDKVRRGNLRWIEAQKVPTLHKFFNTDVQGGAASVVSTTTVQARTNLADAQNFNVPSPVSFSAPPQTFNEPPPQFYQELPANEEVNFCVLHTDAKARYHCETCVNFFCKACPQENNCPMCGAMCTALEVSVQKPAAVNSQSHIFPDQLGETAELSPEVGKAANWFYWKAGLTVINSILLVAGVSWGFALGMTFPLFIQAITLIVSATLGFSDISVLNIAGVVFSIACAGLMVFLGKKAGSGKKWAMIVGLIIFIFDTLVYLASFDIIGIAVHAIALYMVIVGLKAYKK